MVGPRQQEWRRGHLFGFVLIFRTLTVIAASRLLGAGGRVAVVSSWKCQSDSDWLFWFSLLCRAIGLAEWADKLLERQKAKRVKADDKAIDTASDSDINKRLRDVFQRD